MNMKTSSASCPKIYFGVCNYWLYASEKRIPTFLGFARADDLRAFPMDHGEAAGGWPPRVGNRMGGKRQEGTFWILGCCRSWKWQAGRGYIVIVKGTAGGGSLGSQKKLFQEWVLNAAGWIESDEVILWQYQSMKNFPAFLILPSFPLSSTGRGWGWPGSKVIQKSEEMWKHDVEEGGSWTLSFLSLSPLLKLVSCSQQACSHGDRGVTGPLNQAWSFDYPLGLLMIELRLNPLFKKTLGH